MRIIEDLLYRNAANQIKIGEIRDNINDELSNILPNSGIESKISEINKEVDVVNDAISEYNSALETLQDLASEFEDAGISVPRSVTHLGTISHVSELQSGDFKTTEAETAVDNLSYHIIDDTSTIGMGFWDYLIEQQQCNYDDMIQNAKELAESLGLPEEKVVSQQKKIYLKNLESRDLSIDCLAMVSDQFSRSITDFVRNEFYPEELKKIILVHFFESFFTPTGLSVELKENKNIARFNSITSCITDDFNLPSMKPEHVQRIRDTQDLLIDTFKSSRHLQQFMISNFSLKEIEHNRLLKATSEQFIESTMVSSNYATETLTALLSSDYITSSLYSCDSTFYHSYKNQGIGNSLQYFIDKGLDVDLDNPKLERVIAKLPHKDSKKLGSLKISQTEQNRLLSIEEKFLTLISKNKIEQTISNAVIDESDSTGISFKM